MEGGRRKSVMAFAIRMRLPNAMIPISLLRRLTSSSRRTSPVISCSVGNKLKLKLKLIIEQKGKYVLANEFVANVLVKSFTLQPIHYLIDTPLYGRGFIASLYCC